MGVGTKCKRKRLVASTSLDTFDSDDNAGRTRQRRRTRTVEGGSDSDGDCDSDCDKGLNIVRDRIIHNVSLILKGKFHRGILTQRAREVGLDRPGSGSGPTTGNVIFNICGQIGAEDIQRVLAQPYVSRADTYFYCNQFSLVFVVGLTTLAGAQRNQQKPNNTEILDYAALREFVSKQHFQPPPVHSCIGFIHPSAYEALNSMLEIVHFVLFTEAVHVADSRYRNKPPYHTATVQLSHNQRLRAGILDKLVNLQLQEATIKSISIVFDKRSNSMKLIIRVRFRCV